MNIDLSQIDSNPHRTRDSKALTGQAKATLRRLMRDEEEGESIRALLKTDVVAALENYELPTPKREKLGLEAD